MMKLKHYDHDGHARFVTFATNGRLKLLTDDSYCAHITDAIGSVRRKSGLRVIGYVIMPDHVHAVLLPPLEKSLGPIVGDIKRLSARTILKALRSSNLELIGKLAVLRNGVVRTTLWQRRCFDYNCRTEAEMWHAIDYCHQNPVRKGLVDSAAAWKWSSHRWYHSLPDIALEMDAV